jgi:hypothetical protein
MEQMTKNYLETAIKEFKRYKQIAESAMEQLQTEQLFESFNEESNSIAVIINHLSGNMLSRWTDFLTADGEKEWRNRDQEFENIITDKEELLTKWNLGWNCLFSTLESLTTGDFDKTVYIRNDRIL